MWCGRRKPSAGSCRGQSHPPEVCEVYFSVKIHLGLRKTSSNSCSTLIFRTTRNDWRCPQCKPQLLYPLPSPSRVSLLWNLFFPISIVIEFLWRKYNVQMQCYAMYSLHPNVHCSIVFEVQFQTKLLSKYKAMEWFNQFYVTWHFSLTDNTSSSCQGGLDSSQGSKQTCYRMIVV